MPTIEAITLLGSSSGRNAGDAALIAGIMDSIDESCGMRLLYEIPTIKPSFIRSSYANRTKSIGMLPWNLSIKMLGVPTYRSIMRTDLSLVFDAILFDRALYNPLFNFLSTLALLLPHAKKAGKRMGFFNVSAGPVATPAGRRMLRKVAESMDFLTVRDQNSHDLLRDIGIVEQPIIVTADAALTMKAPPEQRSQKILRELGFADGDEILGINVSAYLDTWAGTNRKPMGKGAFIAAYANALNKVLGEIEAPVLFVSTQHHDVPLTLELMSRIKCARHKAHCSNIEYSHYDIRGVLGSLALLFGMRLHATILASAGLAPVLALPHQPKVSHYFKTLGLEDFVLTFDAFSEEALRKHILKGWAERARIRTVLQRSIPVSRERALIAANIVSTLARGQSIESAIRVSQPSQQATVG